MKNQAKIEIQIKRNKETIERIGTNEAKLSEVFRYLQRKYQFKKSLIGE